MQRESRCVTISGKPAEKHVIGRDAASDKPVCGTGYLSRRDRCGVKLDCRSSFSGALDHLAMVVSGKAILIDLNLTARQDGAGLP
jgi:hypothetical protein